MMYYETKVPVRYYETDQMGIVHHSNYIRYFEIARNSMIADAGYPIEKCEADGFTIPVVSLECRYRHPAVMGDVLTVSAAIEQVPLAKLYVRQVVKNQDGVVCAEGKVTLGFLDKRTNRPIGCPEKMAGLIAERIEKQ